MGGRRRRTRAAGLALALLAGLAVIGGGAGPAAGTGTVADFDVGAVGGVVDFRFSYPNLVIPFVVTGGVLEATSLASGSGRAQGSAGVMPVPIATSAGLLIPGNDPVTGQPIPPQVREAIQKVDFSKFPNYCQSDWPPVAEGGDEAYCGGPAAEDARLGFTAAVANGQTKSSGDPEDGLRSRATSESTGTDITIPALQTTVHGAWARSVSGLNGEGVPEGRGEVEIDGLSLLSGLIRFQGLRSETVARSDGTQPGTATTTAFSVRAAFVAGVPVIVGRDGVVVDQQALVPGTTVQGATKTLNDALKVGDVTVRLVPAPAPQVQGSQVSAESEGIEIVHRGTSVTPADSIYRIGFTSARASAFAGSRDGGADLDAMPASGDLGDGGAAPISGDLGAGLGSASSPLPGDGSGTTYPSVGGSGSSADLPVPSGETAAGGRAGLGGSFASGSERSSSGVGAPAGSVATRAPLRSRAHAAPGAVAVSSLRPLPASSVRNLFAGALGVTVLALAAWRARRLLVRRF
jgi:hypothetical protein